MQKFILEIAQLVKITETNSQARRRGGGGGGGFEGFERTPFGGQ